MWSPAFLPLWMRQPLPLANMRTQARRSEEDRLRVEEMVLRAEEMAHKAERMALRAEEMALKAEEMALKILSLEIELKHFRKENTELSTPYE